MIVLDVEKYCHDCPLFEAESSVLCSLDRVVQTVVSCALRDRCKLIEMHLRKEQEKTAEPKKKRKPLCLGCKRFVGCEPDKMALNTEDDPCEDYEKEGAASEK